MRRLRGPGRSFGRRPAVKRDISIRIAAALLVWVCACDKGQDRAAAADASPDGPARCVSTTPPSFCEATYDEQVQAKRSLCAEAGVLVDAYSAGACGPHLVVRYEFGYYVNESCFYDAQTKALVASEACTDDGAACNGTAICEYTGPPIEPACQQLHDLPRICAQHAGADIGG